MSGSSFYIVVSRILRPPGPFPKIWSVSYLRGSGVAHIAIIFVVIVGTSIINHFLVNVADLSFLARSRE
jgi:hypothetical protein